LLNMHPAANNSPAVSFPPTQVQPQIIQLAESSTNANLGESGARSRVAPVTESELRMAQLPAPDFEAGPSAPCAPTASPTEATAPTDADSQANLPALHDSSANDDASRTQIIGPAPPGPGAVPAPQDSVPAGTSAPSAPCTRLQDGICKPKVFTDGIVCYSFLLLLSQLI
jgi:hypothetical protein